jgi:hypothetical protein
LDSASSIVAWRSTKISDRSAIIQNVPPEWELIFGGLGAGASAAAIIGAAWVVVKLVGKGWRSTFGRRRAQAKLLDQLACGSSIEFLESKFGVAQFVTEQQQGFEQRIYRLSGAWVLLELFPVGYTQSARRVYSYSITITSRWMHYSTKRLTFKQLKVKLGKHKFPGHGIGFEGERLWIGAHRWGYLRHYNFRGSGGHQYYWLSYNIAGCGYMSGPFEPGQVDRGIYCDDVNSAYARTNIDPIDSSGITVNTLTALSPEATEDVLAQFMSRDILGVDEATVRLASTIRPPSDMPMRSRLSATRFRIKFAIERNLKRLKRG